MKLLVLLVVFLFIEYSQSFQDLFTLDCQRRLHVTPELPFASGMDVSGPLSILNIAFNEMYEQSKGICPDLTDEEFNNRFGITLPQGLVRLFELEKLPPNECDSRYYQEISTFYNYIKDILPEDPLPPTCNHKVADYGICHFAIELEPFTLQFAIEECPTYPGETIYNRIPFLSVTCEGCDTFLKPCTAHSDCGDDMVCQLHKNFFNKFLVWFGNTTIGNGLVPDELDFFDYGFFDDLMKFNIRGYDLITDFVHSIANGYWHSDFAGQYSALNFCFPDIEYGSDLFLKKYDISDCDGSNVTEEYYCDNILFSSTGDVCSGVGECKRKDFCKCPAGFIGQICEIEVYEHVRCDGVLAYKTGEVCNAHGACVDNDVCECLAGWYGEFCHREAECYGLLSTDPDACGPLGTCVSEDVCECDSGYYEFNKTCDENHPVGCYNLAGEMLFGKFACGGMLGDCVYNGNGEVGVCDCIRDYVTEPSCKEEFECYGTSPEDDAVCGGNGKCVGEDNCVCNAGFSGTICGDEFHCEHDCNSRGYCNKTTLACDCLPGYNPETHCFSPLRCGFFQSNDPEVCNKENGTCTVDGCVCDTNYWGVNCEFVVKCNDVEATSDNVCSGHGYCVAGGPEAGIGRCECGGELSNYYGDDCQYPKDCGGYYPEDPEVCNGTGVCTVGGCRKMAEHWTPTPSEGETNQNCTSALFHILAPWNGEMEDGMAVNSDDRKAGQTFNTQINRIRMEYDPEKPIPLFIYNGDGVFTFLPSHKYLGYAAYFQELDRLLLVLDELFDTLRTYHSDISDVIQKYYYKMWSPLPWLFRFTTFNAENHLNWRGSHFDKKVVRLLKGYKLPPWFKQIEPPMTCSVQQYRDFGNCTLRFSSLSRMFGGEFDLYLKIRRDEKDGPNDYTGIPHMEVWCDGALCHEMYNLKTCKDNLDCESEHCKTIFQTHDYREPTFVTSLPIFEIVEDDGTTYEYNLFGLSALFFEGGFFRMDFTDSMLHPLTFYKKMLALITGNEAEAGESKELNICVLDRKVGRGRHGLTRWTGHSLWMKLRSFCFGLVEFDKIDNFWKNRKSWWKGGGKWWKDGDDDDDDDFDDDDDKDDDNDNDHGHRRGGGKWKDWWKKALDWKKKKREDHEYVMRIAGLNSWNELFCMKQGGDGCGCEEGMVDCVCYEFANENCEGYFNTPQKDLVVVDGVKFIPQDEEGGDDDTIDPPASEEASSAVLLVVCGLMFVVALLF